MALALAWFWIPDATAPAVALSFVYGAAVVVAGLGLAGRAPAFYFSASGRVAARFVLAVWVALAALAVWGLARWPLAWIAALAILLPLAGSVAREGFRGFARPVWRLRFFPAFGLLMVMGVWAPWKLWNWHPDLYGLPFQTVSLVVRGIVSYLLAVTSWLILASLVVRLADRDRAS